MTNWVPDFISKISNYHSFVNSVLRKAASSCIPAFPDDESPIRHRGEGKSRAGDDPDRQEDRSHRRRSKRGVGKDKIKESKGGEKAESRSGRRSKRKSGGRARELEEYICYCESYYRAYYPDWHMQYFSQYEDYLRQSYLTQRDEVSAPPFYDNANAWSGFYPPTQYNQIASPNTALPYHPTNFPQPYAADQYDAGYGWSNWFQAFQSPQPITPLKYSTPLPCLQFSGAGMVQLSTNGKVSGGKRNVKQWMKEVRDLKDAMWTNSTIV